MKHITLSSYLAIHTDYRGTWMGYTHPELIGRRTMLSNIGGATALLIEGISFEIIDDMAPCQKSAGGLSVALSSSTGATHA